MLITHVFPGTSTPASSTAWPIPTETVQFLGLDLTSSKAEVALYVLFTLLVVTGLTLGFVLPSTCRKSKAHNNHDLELSKL